MTYADSAMIKDRMNITGESKDASILKAIAFGDAICDGLIEKAGGSTSVASPTQILREAAADFGAYYMHRATNPSTASLFWNSGLTMMGIYLAGTEIAGALLTGTIGIRDEDE